MEKTLNKDTKEQNQEKEEKIAVEEDVSLDIEENDSIEVPEEISQEETIKDLEDQLLRAKAEVQNCLLYTSPSPRDATLSRMPSSA